jgi:hypothetical protein
VKLGDRMKRRLDLRYDGSGKHDLSGRSEPTSADGTVTCMSLDKKCDWLIKRQTGAWEERLLYNLPVRQPNSTNEWHSVGDA